MGLFGLSFKPNPHGYAVREPRKPTETSGRSPTGSPIEMTRLGGDDPEMAAKLRIEERELEAGGLN